MRFVPRISVGARLTAAILLAIVLSWVLSAGTSSYVAYQRIRALRQEMLRRPDLYPVPIPEPRFRVMDLLLGPRPELGRPPDGGGHPGGPGGPRGFGGPDRFDRPPGPPGPRPPMEGLDNGPPPPRPDGPPQGDRPPHLGLGQPSAGVVLIVRAVIALLLALVAGKWLSSRFTRRLDELAMGAGAFDAGNLGHRVPDKGDDEFSQVAAAMNKMAERVSRQIGTLEQDAESRRQFLADVAHELRGPVATIRTMAGALQDGVAEEPERRERAVSSLVRTSERLLHLVNDLLELARLDLKELPMHPRSVDLRELAVAAIESRAASAAEAGISLSHPEPGALVIASVDPDRFTQALDNLLDNAISYAGSGAEIRVSVAMDDLVRVTVSDNGRGIPASHLQHVFDPFYRVDTARTTSEGHSGLGLRISRGLVRAHGGDLTLTSTENMGTTAEITLPRPSTSS